MVAHGYSGKNHGKRLIRGTVHSTHFFIFNRLKQRQTGIELRGLPERPQASAGRAVKIKF
jgi:IS5 family transposase